MQFSEYRVRVEEERWFDASFYLDSLLHSGVTPQPDLSLFEHYASAGWSLGASPSPRFSVPKYFKAYPDVRAALIDPLYHYLCQGVEEQRKAFPVYERVETPQVLAFYLPQFHPIPENDANWGRGFTEWTNVTRASPKYKQHRQPLLPSELGFYDLRVVDTIKQQAALAQTHGIDAFCFHYYWFNGHRLLYKPLELYLNAPDISLPFCICWANENWTKRWDGLDDEVIIGQPHSAESDYSFIYDALHVLADPRYWRVQGKPLLIVYRPELLAEPAATFELWREVARRAGLGGLFIAGVRFHISEGNRWGLDALVEFPPHHFPAPTLGRAKLAEIGVSPDFQGKIRDYEEGVETRIGGKRQLDVPVFPGVMPGWDNTARRGVNATIYKGSDPRLFAYWLAAAADEARSLEDCELPPLVFLNAWNEWAEGACLEPSQVHGRLFLQAAQAFKQVSTTANPLSEMRRFVEGILKTPQVPVLILSHDANHGGAQILLERLVRSFAENDDIACFLAFKTGGPLLAAFSSLAPCFELDRCMRVGWSESETVEFLARRLRNRRNLVILGNTVATGALLEPFATSGHRIVSYLHELPTSVEMYGCRQAINDIGRYSHRIIACSDFVRTKNSQAFDIPMADFKVIYCGLTRWKSFEGRKESSFPAARHVVVGCGMLHPRKGVDLFIQVAQTMVEGRSKDDYLFVWIGGPQDETAASVERWLMHDATATGIADRLLLTGHVDNSPELIAQADVFLMTSREDPYPIVVLEAVSAGVPVICFEGGGGASELVSKGVGNVVPYLDCTAMARAANMYLTQSEERQKAREVARKLTETNSWDGFVQDMREGFLRLGNDGAQLRSTGHAVGRQTVAEELCVVIPSYNHAHFVSDALDSVLSQSMRPGEIRIIDDGSTDGSADLLNSLASEQLNIVVQTRENKERTQRLIREFEKHNVRLWRSSTRMTAGIH